ncbi:DUF2946 domain-containing protein [Pandoraea apista]|uniref:DUF2946 domain-containing protein n=1 Tax=Pandoraea apista TaxID=93218 RepID=UPI0009E264A6|nr:DUF2946 domain-containing protein [Pandoraea apista]
MLRLRHRRLFAWLGLLAMALVLIAPSVSQWRQAQRALLDDALASAICVASDSQTSAHGRSHDHGLLSQACGYCSVAAHLSPAPGVSGPVSPLRVLLARTRVSLLETRRTEAFPPSPLPRAPPRFA